MEWRGVVGFEGYYEVSDDGQVQSVDRIIVHLNRWGTYTPHRHRGQLLVPWLDRGGYPTVALRRPGGIKRTANVHILMLEAWRGPCPDGMESCHWDDVPTQQHDRQPALGYPQREHLGQHPQWAAAA